MESKTLFSLKNFFFKFNSAFLSGHLEDRLKYHKAFNQLFIFFRKRILFYILSFSLFCFFLSEVPVFLKDSIGGLLTHQNIWNILGKFSVACVLFLGALYLTRFMQSVLLRDIDFYIARVQIASRYWSGPSSSFDYENLKTSHLAKFLFATLSIVPLTVLYKSLFVFLHAWIVIPIFANFISFALVGLFKNKNTHLFKKTSEHYKRDVNFFSSIETFLGKIRSLGFDSILKKKVLSFSENHSFLYQKIFENEIVISGIKYSSVFLIFAINSALFLGLSEKHDALNFLPIVIISFLLSNYFLSLLKMFDYREGAGTVYKFLRRMDTLNARLDPIVLRKEEHNDEEQYVVSFEHASFIKNNQVVFHQLNHHIKRNKLTVVIGSTPEERSNYLTACVGGLEQIGGQVYPPQKFEFLSKHPPLFETSVRENIVLSHDFNQEYYLEVLKACALEKEINLLPDNDLTNLDQFGANFAPSFLRKIAIARVIYAKSDVNFFDDPFADLSQNDSAHIFFEAFQKLLSGTTRIFCMDRTEFAALSDDIILCKGGRVIEQGSHVFLIAYESAYSRLFYAGAESRRFEILQNYTKHDQSETISPLRQKMHKSENKPNGPSFLFGELLFERFKAKLDKFSHFMRVFFPIFVSKNFYAFFTFLTLAVWSALYSFYFIFQNLNLNVVEKTTVLFLAFSMICCLSFSVMLIFYKNVYATCAYIIENIYKFYFANLMTAANGLGTLAQTTREPMASPGLNAKANFDWRNEHIHLVTGKFFNQLLNFLIIGFFCLGLIIFASTFPVKIVMLSVLGIFVTLLFVHTTFETKIFFDEEDSKHLNEKFQLLAKSFFEPLQETQSKNMKDYLLERIHAKLYGLYFSEFSDLSKSTSIARMLGFHALWKNYSTIENMISSIKLESRGLNPRSLSNEWPVTGVIQVQNVKFDSEFENANNFVIPRQTRLMFSGSAHIKKSVFIDKLRLNSPVLSGEIHIDGEDITLLHPTDLRRRIGYISQSSFIPFLSIRDHIDPYGYYDDADVWDVLNKVSLSQHVALLKQGLSTLMEHLPQEMVWSGEVVLISFARCILNKTKIICIDHIEIVEDVENKICHLVESELQNSTIIFALENEKFKNLCNMHYPNNSVQNEQYLTLPNTEQSKQYLQD